MPSRRAIVPVVALLCAALARGEDEKTDPPGTLLPGFTPEGGGGNYNYVGASRFIGGSEVELTANEENSVGAIWSKEVNHADGWEMQFLVQTTGEADSPGKGLAFWYTNQPLEVGTLYGSDERFEGFGLLFDSHDDDGKNDNPIIMGFVNDGTKVFNHDTDGLGTRFGGCRAKYRNRGNKVGVKITYSQDSIKVLLDMRNNGVWERCLAKDSIYLATGSHIGFSAANLIDSVGDNIKISEIKLYDLETDKSIAAQEEEIARQEDEERKRDKESGEIHSLAEQLTGMQKNLHDEFLQKIAGMIQRDHVTSSHEFRAIRFQLTSMLEKSGSPKEVLNDLQTSVSQLKESFTAMNEELEQLKSNRGNGEEMKTLSRNIQNIKNTMEGHAHAHAGIKGSIKEHIEVSYWRINANIHTVCT
jgi:mannose-binding lectin 1